MKMWSAEQASGSSITKHPSPISSLATLWEHLCDVGLHLCVSAGKDKKTEAAILSADAMSPFSALTLKEVSLLFPPWHSPTLEQHGRHVQIPKHSSIRTFWLLTRPQKMVDMCCLQGARQGFSRVTLSLSLKWEITLRNRLADALWDSLSCAHTKSHRQLLTLVKRTVTYIACFHQNTYAARLIQLTALLYARRYH